MLQLRQELPMLDGNTARSVAADIVDAIAQPLVALNRDLKVEVVNEAFLRQFDVLREETVGRSVFEIGNGQWDLPELRRLLGSIPDQQSFDDCEVEQACEAGHRMLVLNACRLAHLDLILLGIRDITGQREAERQAAARETHQRVVVEIADAVRALADSKAVMARTSELLGRHLGAGQVGYAEIDAAVEYATIEQDWNDGTIPSNVGRHRIQDFGGAFLDELKRGTTVAVDDVQRDPRVPTEALAAFERVAVGALLLVPLVKNDRLAALLTINSRDPRAWCPAEIALAEEIAERTWAAVERARAEAALRDSEARYRLLFNSIDEGFCVIEMIFDDAVRPVDYRFLEVNAAFERQTGLADAVGKTMRSLAPHHEEHWFEIYGAIALSGNAQRFEQQAAQLGRTYDVYAFRIGKPEERKLGILFDDITEQKRAEAQLRESEARLQDVLKQLPVGVGLVDTAGRFTLANPALRHLVGEFMPSRDPASQWRAVDPAGRAISPNDYPGARALRGETPPEMDFVTEVMDGEQWVRVAAVPLLRGEDVSGAVIVAEDITERKRAEQHIRLLLREVSHRSKNMLSVVQAVARHTAASNPDDFIRYFEERVRALSAGQDLLVKSEWRGADLEDLVRAQLAHFENLLDVRIRLRGPALLVSAPASQTLGMALHELGTNSGKYGALSTDTGQVDVVWDVTRAETAEQQFMIAWIEHGGPRVEKPSRRGFGSTVLCDVAGTMLGAAVSLDYPPAGLTWRLDCPAKNVLEPAAPGMGHWP